MKKLLAIAVAAALVAPAAAMADTTLYGKLHASVGSVKNTINGASTTTSTVESHASRFGVKGATALDNGMEATYGLEYGIDLDGEASTSLTSRNTFVGLKGNFGEVRVGKHDTPAKLATAGQDVFADTYADMGNIINVDNHRVNNAVAYINKFGPVGFAYAHSTNPVGAEAGPNANSAMVNYSNGPWYAGLGLTSVQGQALSFPAPATSVANTPSVAKHVNLGLGYKAEAGHQVNLVLENSKATDGSNTKQKAALINGVYKIGNVSLKAQYGEAKDSGYAAGSNGKEKLTTVGADYSLGKKTSVYLMHSDNKNPSRVTGGVTEGNRSKATAVGLVTEF